MASGLNGTKTISSVELCCLEVSVQLVSALSSSTVVAASPLTCHLTLTILLRGPSSSPQAVEVRITDPSEPLLLLSSVVAAADYPTLRHNQGLLVEFSSFPQRLVELLQLCKEEQDSSQPKFVLVLSGAGPGLLTGTTGGGSAGLVATFANSASGGLVLEVVESNPFKRLSHLSLSVCSASTHDKLCYLASCIDNLKNSSATDHKHLHNSYNAVQEELQQCRQQLQQCKEESARQQQQGRDAADQQLQRHQLQLQEEREKLLKERSDGDRRVSRVRSELEARAATQQRRLESLTADNRAAAEHRAHAEAALREVRERLSSTESSCSQLRAEQVQLRAGLAQAQEQLHGTRSRGADLERRLDESEHDRAELRRSLQHTSNAFDQAREKQSELEAALSASAAKCSKREASAAAVFMELQKSLQVIRSLQQRTQLLQQQKEEREEAFVQQEKVLVSSTGRVTALEGRLEEAEKRLRDAKQQVGDLEEQKRHLQNQLTESKERAASHEKGHKTMSSFSASTTGVSGNTDSIAGRAVDARRRSQDCVGDNARGNGNSAKGVDTCALATSTPLSAPLLSDRAGPLRQSAFNSLSAVHTPGGGGGLPPLHEGDEGKENSPSGGLGPEYLTATTKNKNKPNSGGGLTVRGLIPARRGGGCQRQKEGQPSVGTRYNCDDRGARGDAGNNKKTECDSSGNDVNSNGSNRTDNDNVHVNSRNNCERVVESYNNGISKNDIVTNKNCDEGSALRGGLLRETSTRPGSAPFAPSKERSTAGARKDWHGTGQEKVIAVAAGRGENVHIIDTGQVFGRTQARRSSGRATWKH